MQPELRAAATGQAAATPSRWQPGEGVLGLLADHNASVPSVGLERAIHYTRFFREERDAGLGPHRRWAQALAWHLRQRSIRIHPGEQLVGSHTEHRIGAICLIEKAGLAMLEDLDTFATRPVNPLGVDPEAAREVRESVLPYWQDRTLIAQALRDPQAQAVRAAFSRPSEFLIGEAGGVAHFIPNYAQVIQLGTDGLRDRLLKRLEETPATDEAGRDFLLAGLDSLDGLEAFADRYRAEAKRIGREDLAALLEQSPRRPAASLHAALQTIWWFQLAIQIESMDQGISLGRIDQYLWPIYQRDLERGLLDADRARELIACLCLKLSEVIPLFSTRVTPFLAGLPSGQALTLGGQDAEGEDAANPLSFLFLDVLEAVRTRQPNWHARVHPRAADAWTERLVELLAAGCGSPALYNDAAIRPALAARGVDPADTWDYATVGCVEPAVAGRSFTDSDATLINVAANLTRLLEGLLEAPERLAAPDPGAAPAGAPGLSNLAIDGMEELMAALQAEFDAQIDCLKRAMDVLERINRQAFPTPLSSLTVDGCIQAARDLTAGGARYNGTGVQGVGVADVANALAAIEEWVFERRVYSLRDVAAACAADFRGHELLRARLLSAPKYGNDQARADRWMQRTVELFDRAVSRHRNTRGGPWMPGFYSMTCHRGFGALTPALPSGRGAGESLADGLAPADGSDREGPTASLNSAASLDSRRFGNGINLNLKLGNPAGRPLQPRHLRPLLEVYFERGGMQIQINVIDQALLEEAMRHPERHRNLIVRVSGYTAYFVDLTPDMQRELIARTSHG